MNPSDRAPSDDELDRLLSRRLKDTTPEFEARWVELKRTLRNTPRRRTLFPAAAWRWLLAAAAAALVLAFVIRAPAPRPPSPATTAQLAELWSMNDVLAAGTPLLDPENRADLLFVAHPDFPVPLSP